MTLSRWERLADWPLMATSVLFLVAYSAQVLSSGILLQSIAGWVLIAAWGVFLVDYVVSLYLAGARGRWFIHHLLDLATVALPVLRPLRLLRLVKLISVLQRVAGNALRGRVVTYVVASSALLVYVGALAMYDAEKGHSGSNIASFGDSLWWAVVTITTVGYGDYSPVTTGGRLIAVGLMIGGIALLGVVTATLASWLVERVSTKDSSGQAATVEHVTALQEEVRLLRTQIEGLAKPGDGARRG